MSFLDLVSARRSCRRYDPARPVERDRIERCLEAARRAPSASNGQPWRFVVVSEPGLRERVARCTFGVAPFNRFCLQASHLVVVVVEPSGLGTRLHSGIKRRPLDMVDIGIAVGHLCLQATEEGLGTCIMGWFRERELRRHLGVPATRRIALVIALGWPAPGWDAKPRGRKSLDEIRAYDRYDREREG